MSGLHTELREFRPSDVEQADALREEAGWNQTPRDWLRLLDYQPRGCFVATRDATVIGTVTTTAYHKDLGWIGMMLVSPACRRQGVATRLMRAAIDHLREMDVACIKLDATPAGLPVYERLGFVAEFDFHRWMLGGWTPGDDGERDSIELPQAQSSPALREADYRLDRQAFGADRSRLLALVACDSVVTTSPDGFGMLRRGRRADYLGPITTSSLDSARAIVAQLLGASREPVFWDVPAANTAAVELARSLNFQPVRELTRMRLGDQHTAPVYSHQFALIDPGTG